MSKAHSASAAMAAALMPLLTACFGHVTPASATMSGLEAPVLLGPVDRVGGGEPLATETVREFEATSKHSMTQQSDSQYSYTIEMAESDLLQEAEYATRGSKDLDIRLSEVKPQAVGTIAGVKARVDIEGEVVKVKKSGGKR